MPPTFIILISIRNIPANRAATTGQNGCHGSIGMFLIGISIIKLNYLAWSSIFSCLSAFGICTVDSLSKSSVSST